MADVKYFAKTIDTKSREQVESLASIPAFSNSKIRIMPDVHAGAGCVIGFTADLGDKVVPNVVGVDIGCGMYAVNLGSNWIDLKDLDYTVKEYIPSGQNVGGSVSTLTEHMIDEGLWCGPYLKNKDWLIRSMGTLGGGNHFIELDMDRKGDKWLVIHSGSRNIGKQVAEYYQNKAINTRNRKDYRWIQDELIDIYKANGWHSEISHLITSIKHMEINHTIPERLCYLEGVDVEHYLHDMRLCQDWAKYNREEIARKIAWNLNKPICMGHSFHTVHNYIEHDTNIVRKGAVSAYEGQRLLIPMNMRDGILYCSGKGNPDWNYSAPHGAGRIMSRREARKNISEDEFANSMRNVYTTTANSSTIDEAPMAYKPMDEIISCIGDTVDILDVWKPLYNFKAAE